jgi:outer membrane receptor for ferrienterochelin and colicins
MNYHLLLTSVAFILCCQSLQAQGFSIGGTVSDRTTKEPLSGSNVNIEGTTIGIATDRNGRYTIKHLAPGNYTIAVSYIGYTTQKEDAIVNTNIDNLNFSLESSSILFDEVVITGTGTEHYLKEAPVQTEVISGSALKEYAGRDIGDVLGGCLVLKKLYRFFPFDRYVLYKK